MTSTAGEKVVHQFSDFHGSNRMFTHYFFIQSLIILLGNTCCIYFILSRGKLRRKCSNILMVGLLFSHMTMASAFIVYYVSTSIKGHKFILIVYLYKLREISFVASFVFIVVLSLDRLFDSKRPYYYRTLTWRYTLMLMTVGFLAITSYFLFIISTKEIDSASSCIISVATTSVLSATNYTVHNEVKKQASKIVAAVVTDMDEQRMKTLKRIKGNHLVSLKISSLLTVTFVFFWLPYFIMIVLGSCKFLDFKEKVVMLSYHATVLFGGFNSIADPIIYIILNKKDILRDINCSRTTISTNVNREDSSNDDYDFTADTFESDDYNSYQTSSWI